MKQVKTLNPFGRFCCTIGNLPTSYMESLTYEQQLLWFLKFLDEEVIPAVNENASAIVELQNYLKNLNLQDYVDNKLDEMAESGELTEIIAQYLQLAGLLCFNTKANMKAAENLVNGSFAKTFGTTTYNDGYGYFYKIRTLLNTDVIDDDNLIALTNYPTLVAEKIVDATISGLVSDVATMKTTLDNLTFKEKYLILGDSYGASNNSWIDKIITLFGNDVDCVKVALGGAGFAHTSSLGYSFLTYLQHVEDTITDKNHVTKIIVGGGYNDYNYTTSEIYDAIEAFCSYCLTTYPNAKIYIACIGFNKGLSNYSIRNDIATKVVPAYSDKYLVKNSPIYITNSEYILKNDNLIGDDNVHPTSAGQNYIAKYIYTFLLTDTPIPYKKPEKQVNLVYNDVNYPIKYVINEDSINLRSNSSFVISSFPAGTNFVSGGALDGGIANMIGVIEFEDVYPSLNYLNFVETTCGINCTEGNFRNIPCTLWLRHDRKLALILHTVTNGSYQTYSNVSLLTINNYLKFSIPTYLN